MGFLRLGTGREALERKTQLAGDSVGWEAASCKPQAPVGGFEGSGQCEAGVSALRAGLTIVIPGYTI